MRNATDVPGEAVLLMPLRSAPTAFWEIRRPLRRENHPVPVWLQGSAVALADPTL